MNKWCMGCVWASDTGVNTYCPFVEGSCVKVKGTLENPDPERVFEEIILSALRSSKGEDTKEKDNEQVHTES